MVLMWPLGSASSEECFLVPPAGMSSAFVSKGHKIRVIDWHVYQIAQVY